MLVKFLPSSAYMGIEVQNPEETGITEGSHIAAINFPGEKRPVRCYVKFCGPQEYDLFYEILGYTLAHKLGIKQPDKAGVIIVPIKRIRDNGGIVPRWIGSDVEYYPAFCTQESPVRSIRYLYNTNALLLSKYQDLFINNHNWYSTVSAFDEWLANNDRNGGNILKLSDKVYSIIDHGRLFDNKAPSNVHTKDLVSENKMHDVINNTLGDKDREKLNNSMAAASHNHSNARYKSISEIKEWLTFFDGIDESIVNSFIDERSRENWMENRVGVI
jgi:hypothetical protein